MLCLPACTCLRQGQAITPQAFRDRYSQPRSVAYHHDDQGVACGRHWLALYATEQLSIVHLAKWYTVPEAAMPATFPESPQPPIRDALLQHPSPSPESLLAQD